MAVSISLEVSKHARMNPAILPNLVKHFGTAVNEAIMDDPKSWEGVTKITGLITGKIIACPYTDNYMEVPIKDQTGKSSFITVFGYDQP